MSQCGPSGPFEVVDGCLDPDAVLTAVRTVIAGQTWPREPARLHEEGPGRCTVRVEGVVLTVRSAPLPAGPPGTLDAVTSAGPAGSVASVGHTGSVASAGHTGSVASAAYAHRVLVSASGPLPPRAQSVFAALVAELGRRAQCYTQAEADTIVAAMPLLGRYDAPEPAFADWALIFRDHYVENSVGLLLAMERAGIAPEWIYALSKGDRTLHRDRVHTWFLHRGYASDVLDNSVINGTADEAARAEALAVDARVEDFIRRAHAVGRKVLVIDDGGLLAQGRGSDNGLVEPVDAAIELTVSGLKRIHDAPGRLAVPVLNLARSQLKSRLGYNEIADSCVRRLRAIVPGEKFIGRHVLVLGYGTLGNRVAHALRALGCRVHVVDTDILALITAAEDGFETHRTIAEALTDHRPFLVIGSSGGTAVTERDVPLLADGTLLAGFATKDFSVLSEGRCGATSTPVPYVGVRHHLPHGATVTLLGDGRSLNLYEYEGIANRGYDAYRAGTLLAAKRLCRDVDSLTPGVHLDVVDELIDEAGLFPAYYDCYLREGRPAGTGPYDTTTPVGDAYVR
ncbi:hypothetical protein GCM10010349_73890 [Streptomyces flavofungini]|nr:hypothetical protein GCM10010349_73890 [Streptomyces flavofungini]